MLMRRMGPESRRGKELAYALYDIAANKLNDATEATAYNSLISAWSELTAQAANISEQDLSGDAQSRLHWQEAILAKTSRQYVFDGMELLPEPLATFVEARLSGSLSGYWQVEVQNRYKALRIDGGKINWDQQSLFQVMNIFWDQAFKDVFSRTERAWVNELVEVRNKLSHDEKL